MIRFGIPTLLSTAAPLLSVIVITHTQGAGAFLALGLGQSLGGIAAIMVTWGWDVTGPQGLLVRSATEQRALLFASLASRLTIFGVVLVPLLVGSLVVAPTGLATLTILTSVAAATQGLSPLWWLAGVGRPRLYLWYDAAPRAVSALTSAAAIVLAGHPELYPILTLIFVTTSYGVFYGRYAKSDLAGTPLSHIRPTLRTIRSNAPSAGISICAVIYNTTTLPITQIVAPIAATQYASAARLLNYWSVATVTTNNAIIGTVDGAAGSTSAHARRRALTTLTLQSLILALILLALAPWVSEHLFTIRLENRFVAIFMATAFLLNGINTGLAKYILIPQRAVRHVFFVTLAAALTGIVTIIPAAQSFGAAGAVGSVASAELTTFLGFLAWWRRSIWTRGGSAHDRLR